MTVELDRVWKEKRIDLTYGKPHLIYWKLNIMTNQHNKPTKAHL